MDDTDLHWDRQEGRQAAGLWWSPGPLLSTHPRPPVLTLTPCFCLVNPGVWVNEKGLDHWEERQSSLSHLCSPPALRDSHSMTGPPSSCLSPCFGLYPLGHTISSGCPLAANKTQHLKMIKKINKKDGGTFSDWRMSVKTSAREQLSCLFKCLAIGLGFGCHCWEETERTQTFVSVLFLLC